MIEVIDRISTYPGRVKLIPVEGQANTYDMVRADEPIEPGTPINKALFDSYYNMVTAAVNVLDNKIFELTQRVKLSSLADGTVFGLYENGILVPYIKLTYARYDTNRVQVLRQDCVKMDTAQSPSDIKGYQNSKIDLWLNNEFVATLDAATQGVLQTTTISGSSGTDYENDVPLVRKVFLLSAMEYDQGYIDWIPSNGYQIPYFKGYPDRRIAKYNGSPVEYWTRSISYSQWLGCAITTSGGYVTDNPSTAVKGIRPAFMLPADYVVTVGVPSTSNAMATSEVI